MDYKPLIKVFAEENGLVEHHTRSYNEFVEKGIQKIIEEIKYIEPEIEGFKIRLDNIRLERPTTKEADGSIREVYPNETRLRDLTYSASIILEMTTIENGVEKEHLEAKIGELPVMLNSSLCYLNGKSYEERIKMAEDPRDPGGYFIVNGTERVLVLIEDLAPNQINVEKSAVGTIAEDVRIFSERSWYRRRNSVQMDRHGALSISTPPFSKPLPFIIVMRAFGIGKDSEIAKMVSDDLDVVNDLYVSFSEAEEATSVEDALDFIGKRVAFGKEKDNRMDRAQNVLNTFLLPHIGMDKESNLIKAQFLALMAEKAIKLHLGKMGLDDKDHYSNKRLRLAGTLFEDLFRVAFRALVSNTVYSLEKSYKRSKKIPVLTAIRSNFLTERIQHAIATGAWIGNTQGVSQHLDRMNYVSAISHQRRVRSLLSTTQPHFEARDLHATHWGRLCPSETPEGSNIGLVKNLALLSKISSKKNEAVVEEAIEKMNLKESK